MRTRVRAAAVAGMVLAWTGAAGAQTASTPLPEEVEPRVIGAAGTMMASFSGYVDRFFSSERGLPFNYSMQIDVGRFVTNDFVIRGGLRGSGSVGGDEAEDLPNGPGAPATHAFAGVLYYFTPQSILSAYVGADYWGQLTRRNGRDAGSIVGLAGLQGLLSSRVGVFVEGGYGAALVRDDDDVRVTRMLGQIGVRVRF